MKLANTLCALTLFGHASVCLIFPVVLAVQRTSSLISDGNMNINQNGEVQETSVLDSENNVQNDKDVTRNAREGHPVTHTASEKFLESLREKCKKYTSISLICNSLRLVLPITPPQSPQFFAASEDATNPEDADNKELLENVKLQKRFTEPSQFTDIETHILRPEEYDETTSGPAGYHSDYYHNHREASAIKNQDTVYDVVLRESQEDSGSPHMFYDGNHKQPNVPHNTAYENHMMPDNLESNSFVNTGNSEKPAYSEIPEENVEKEINSPERDMSRNVTYQNQLLDTTEDNFFRTTGEAKQISSSEFMEEQVFRSPNSDINRDDDEMEKSEEGKISEIEEGDNKGYVHEDSYKGECNDRANCHAGESSTDEGSEDALKEENNGKSEMVDRFVNDSLKIFKNSLTIKFPTFERVTNKISEWFQSVFGTKSRDEARGKLKKTLSPIIIGLMVKGIIIIASVVGLVMKFIAAKAVILSIASVIFTVVAIFKKYNAPQGGTIYVHSNGGAAHKTGSSWDKEGYGPVYQPHRVSKDASGYQMWENIKKQRGEYSTPTGLGDRYYQYYNSYYRPNTAMYTTTMSPY